MEIHPYTNHDIARLRGEERLVRALAAHEARQAIEPSSSRSRNAFGAAIHLLQRITRRRARAAAHAPTGV